MRSSSVGSLPVAGTTKALARSPRSSSGRPTTQTSWTTALPRSTSSTSNGLMLLPPRMIVSFTRPVTCRYPSSSSRPRSPKWAQPSSEYGVSSSPQYRGWTSGPRMQISPSCSGLDRVAARGRRSASRRGRAGGRPWSSASRAGRRGSAPRAGRGPSRRRSCRSGCPCAPPTRGRRSAAAAPRRRSWRAAAEVGGIERGRVQHARRSSSGRRRARSCRVRSASASERSASKRVVVGHHERRAGAQRVEAHLARALRDRRERQHAVVGAEAEAAS